MKLGQEPFGLTTLRAKERKRVFWNAHWIGPVKGMTVIIGKISAFGAFRFRTVKNRDILGHLLVRIELSVKIKDENP